MQDVVIILTRKEADAIYAVLADTWVPMKNFTEFTSALKKLRPKEITNGKGNKEPASRGKATIHRAARGNR